MNTTARDWFTDDYDFRQLCCDALSLARSEGEQEFAHDMMLAANEHGLDTSLSSKQLNWLCQIGDRDPPARRSAPSH